MALTGPLHEASRSELDARHMRMLEMVFAGDPIVDVAKKLDVTPRTIYTWLGRPDVAVEYDRMLAMQRRSLERAISAMAQSVAHNMRLGLEEDIGANRVNMTKYAADRILGSPKTVAEVKSMGVAPEVTAWLATAHILPEDEE